MNVRLSFLLVAVLIIFGGTFLVVRLTDSNEPPQDQDWLYRISDEDIVHIEVTSGGQTVNYDKAPGSARWVIEGDPEIPVFLQDWSGTTLLLSGPRVNRTLATEINDPAQYGLEPPMTVVKVSDRADRTYEFHLGLPTPDEQNQYARLIGDPKLFSVPEIWGQVIGELATKPPYLKMYELAEGDTVVSIQVTLAGETVVYDYLGRDTGWVIAEENPDAPDTPIDVPIVEGGLGDLPITLASPRVDRIITENLQDTEKASYGLESPAARVRIFPAPSTRIPKDILLGDLLPEGDYRHAMVDGEETVYAMSEELAQRLMRLASEPLYPPDNASDPASPG